MSLQKRRFIIKNIPPSSKESDIASYFKSLGDISEVSICSNANGSFSFFTAEGSTEKLDKALSKYASKVWDGYNTTLELSKKESFMARLKRERAEEAEKLKSNESSNSKSAFPEKNRKETLNGGIKEALDGKRVSKKRSSSSLKDSPTRSSEFIDAKTLDESNTDSVSGKDRAGVKMFTGTSSLYHGKKLEDAKSEKHGQNSVMTSFAEFDSMWADSETAAENSSALNSFIGNSSKSEKRSKNKTKENVETAQVNPMTKNEKKKRDDERRRQSITERALLIKKQRKLIKSSLSSNSGQNKNKIVFDTEDGEDLGACVVGPKKGLFDDEEYGDDDPIKIPALSEEGHEKRHKLMQLQGTFSTDERFKLDERFLDDEAAHRSENRRKSNTSNTMVRYDPEKSNGYTNTVDDRHLKQASQETPVVSKETFYEVSEKMKFALKEKTPGFSLLAAYGGNRRQEPVENCVDSQIKPLKARNPLIEDSSDESADEMVAEDAMKKEEAAKAWKPFVSLPSGPRDNFFFTVDDPLFADAFNFINKKNSEEAAASFSNYDTTRRELKKIVKEQFLKRSKKAAMFRKKIGGMKKKPINSRTNRNLSMNNKVNHLEPDMDVRATG